MHVESRALRHDDAVSAGTLGRVGCNGYVGRDIEIGAVLKPDAPFRYVHGAVFQSERGVGFLVADVEPGVVERDCFAAEVQNEVFVDGGSAGNFGVGQHGDGVALACGGDRAVKRLVPVLYPVGAIDGGRIALIPCNGVVVA